MPTDRAITCDAVRTICEADGKSYAVLVAIDRAAGTTQFTTWGKTPEDKVEAKGLADYMASDLCPADPAKPQKVYESFVLDAAQNKARAEALADAIAHAITMTFAIQERHPEIPDEGFHELQEIRQHLMGAITEPPA